MTMDSWAALFLMFAAFNQGNGFNFPISIQSLKVKCKTAEDRDEIELEFDKLKEDLLRAEFISDLANLMSLCESESFSVVPVPTKQDCQTKKWAFNSFKNDDDNSLTILVNEEKCAFDLLSFIEPFLDCIVSVSMSGVNKFNPEKRKGEW